MKMIKVMLIRFISIPADVLKDIFVCVGVAKRFPLDVIR